MGSRGGILAEKIVSPGILSSQMTSTRTIAFSAIVLLALLLLTSALYLAFLHIRDDMKDISDLTFQEIEAQVQNRSATEAQVESFITSVLGEKVRWTGTVKQVDKDNTVYVDIDGYFSDVEFRLSREAAVPLAKGDTVVFTGIIQEVNPGWFGCSVVLRKVEIRSPHGGVESF